MVRRAVAMHTEASNDVHEQYGRPKWAEEPVYPPPQLRETAQRAIDIYMLSKQPDGVMGGLGWWQTANGYTATSLHDLACYMKHNYEVLAAALRGCEHVNGNSFINEYNDDSLWWALCCMRMYSLKGELWYLKKARTIWCHVVDSNSIVRRGQVQFNDQDMEGAVFWTTRRDEEQINAITTGLFAELSLRLAAIEDTGSSLPPDIQKKLSGENVMTKDSLICYAQRSLDWIFRCRYRPSEAIVLDNILVKQQKAQDWTFTYNTGVTIGASALLYEATHQLEYLHRACEMAQQSMRRSSWVESNGVLTESGPYGPDNHRPEENSDAVGFKAVLIRHLVTLYQIIRSSNLEDLGITGCADLIKQFVNINVQSQQERNTSGNGQYGPWWNGPFEMPTSHSQMAVLDVMAAAVLVNAI